MARRRRRPLNIRIESGGRQEWRKRIRDRKGPFSELLSRGFPFFLPRIFSFKPRASRTHVCMSYELTTIYGFVVLVNRSACLPSRALSLYCFEEEIYIGFRRNWKSGRYLCMQNICSLAEIIPVGFLDRALSGCKLIDIFLFLRKHLWELTYSKSVHVGPRSRGHWWPYSNSNAARITREISGIILEFSQTRFSRYFSLPKTEYSSGSPPLIWFCFHLQDSHACFPGWYVS